MNERSRYLLSGPDSILFFSSCVLLVFISFGGLVLTCYASWRRRHIPSGHKLYPFPLVKKHQRTELFAHCQPWTGKLKGETLRLRIYAVDAPESAKMGRPGQPFSEVRRPLTLGTLLFRRQIRAALPQLPYEFFFVVWSPWILKGLFS